MALAQSLYTPPLDPPPRMIATPGSPYGERVQNLERAFVQAVLHDRALVKYLRRVPIVCYLDAEARGVAGSLLHTRPIVGEVCNEDGVPVTALDPSDMAGAVGEITENARLRLALSHGRSLARAAERNDRDLVDQLLKTRLTAYGADSAMTVGQAMPGIAALAAGVTHVPRLPQPLGGRILFAPGSILTIGGDPGGAKTALLESLLINLAAGGTPCLDISIELEQNAKACRYMQHIAGPKVSYKAVLDGTFDPVLLKASSDHLSKLPLTFNTSAYSIAQICDAIRQGIDERGIKVVGVDFIQLIQDSLADGDYVRITAAVTTLAELAKETGVAMIWLSQLRREGRRAGVRATMTDYEGSGRIEQLTWTAAIIQRPVNPSADPGQRDIYFDKVRLGETGLVPARFDGPTLNFDFGGKHPKLVVMPALASLGSVALL